MKIVDDLRERIASGQLAPGADVPTESELAERWKTSRGPVRNALAALRNEGLIETGRGRPARVRDAKALQRVDSSIPFTRWAREIGAQPGARTQELALRRAGAEKAAMFGISADDVVVDVLRLRLLDDRPTMLERLTYIEPVGRLLFDADLDAVSITEYLAQHGHYYAEADHEIEAIAADETDSRLLDVESGAPLLRLRRISRDSSGRTFEASDDRYLSDIVRFTVSTSGRARQGDGYVRPLASA